MYSIIYFADNYTTNAYGSGAYGSASTVSSQGSGTGAASTSGSSAGKATLTNTGFDLLLIASLACFLIFLALVVRFWKKPSKN